MLRKAILFLYFGIQLDQSERSQKENKIHVYLRHLEHLRLCIEFIRQLKLRENLARCKYPF